MANENKKINELVLEDDDPTAEFDASTVRRAWLADGEENEADAKTFDFDKIRDDVGDSVSVDDLKSDLQARSETIKRLQFDIQQLHSKWLGLEAEIQVREETTRDLNAELKSIDRKLKRKEKLLADRDRTIKSLKSEIRDRDSNYRDLQALADDYLAAKTELENSDELEKTRERLQEYEGRVAAQESELEELRSQQARTESYADELRRKFTKLNDDSGQAFSDRDELQQAVEQASEQIEALRADIEESRASAEAAARTLQEERDAHEQELRTLRFELGEAQDTLSDRDKLSEELAAELVDSRNTSIELEQMLAKSGDENRLRVEELEQKVSELEAAAVDYEAKLAEKSEAIHALMKELARKSKEIESIGELDDVIQDIDDRMSERIVDRPPQDSEPVTRLLVGLVDDKEVRFPLFKERLTIGRSKDNDIQLQARFISRQHAVIQTEGDTTRVIDWGSKNGVYVNSLRVSEQALSNGDILMIGTGKFRYEERPKRDN